MKAARPVREVPATPEYFLAALRDHHRLLCGMWWIEADKTASFGLDSKVQQWYAACGSESIAMEVLHRMFELPSEDDMSDAEERRLVKFFRSLKDRTLREVFVELATYARRRPCVDAATFAGKPCRAAGAFLTLQSRLTLAGVREADKIAPSTPLGPFLRRHWISVGRELAMLAPGALPRVEVVPISNPWPERGMTLGCLGALLAAAGIWAGFALPSTPLWVGAATLLARSLLLHLRSLHLWIPDHVAFGDLRTFRDLAVLIARHSGEDAKHMRAPAC